MLAAPKLSRRMVNSAIKKRLFSIDENFGNTIIIVHYNFGKNSRFVCILKGN